MGDDEPGSGAAMAASLEGPRNQPAERRRDIVAKSSSSLPESSRWARDDEPSRQQQEQPDRARSRLGQVKSLDATPDSGAPPIAPAAARPPSGANAAAAAAPDDQRRASVESPPRRSDALQRPESSKQRQMFSLRQLTLSKTRTLAGGKKQAGKTPSKTTEQDQPGQWADADAEETGAGSGRNGLGGEADATTTSGSSDADEPDDEFASDDESCSDEDEEEEERSAGERDSAAESCASDEERAGRPRTRPTPSSARQRPTRRRRRVRRASLCQCEPVTSRLDHDCQPVTDVDLASYKHLCQLEQKQQQLVARQQRRGRRRWPVGPYADAQLDQLGPLAARNSQHLPAGGRCQRTATQHSAHNARRKPAAQPHPLNRRLSLQEESGAYYELCVGPEERRIRQKYVWFPPSLKTLQLVDQFFSYFPKDKIPYSSAGRNDHAAEDANSQQQQQATRQLEKGQKASCGEQQAAPQQQVPGPQAGGSLAGGSYRDEQISVQLPRQDISLDYCSYHLSEASRASYLQFVDKRNSQSLDVGTVVQIKPASGGAQAAAARKPPSAIGPATGALGAQRCRRCLIRFEPGQLAVVAPNFALGTGFYHNQLARIRAEQAESPSGEPGEAPCRRGSVGVQDERPATGARPPPAKPNSAMFHPNCFTCATCREFLIDLVYCLRDSKLYCLRHYGESLRPRCTWCQELIFSDEYLKAMNENFHVDHFLCRHCDSNLAGQRYVLKEEKPYCIGCYEGNFANTCEDCRKPIGIDSRDLSYKERHWHDTCFVCQQCQRSLIDKPFGSKADKVYCADCYDTTFATRCDGCKNPFRAGSKKMEYRGRQWHDSCFCCCVCLNTIGSSSFIPKNEEIYCIKCYEDKYATRCTKCKQVIVSGGVTFRNEPWHRECFKCCNCNKSLAGQRFTTKDSTTNSDTNSSGSLLNKTNQPHNAYCIDCYGELFAKKCFACTQAITGLGGTRFVTFEDRSWHNDCFICNDCQLSLVGKGFITDGPDTILCGDCARAKLR